MNPEKKKIEAYVLASAREAGAPVPGGEIPGEEPDFRFRTGAGALGIELTELLRPASSNHGIVPVEEESYHKDVVRMGEEAYYRTPNAKPVRVGVCFTNARGKRRGKTQMASTLTEFVRSKTHQAQPFVSFYGFDVPEGFSSITILSDSDSWSSTEGGGVTLSDIMEQLAARITSKNKLVATYRGNLPAGAQLWLLLYTTVTVSRSMPIPHGVEESKFAFDFDRVFWFACLEKEVVEIRRA
ncbi:MAG: hypothetical protein ACYDD2_13065 [Candidatus Acidiferrales bacterium]